MLLTSAPSPPDNDGLWAFEVKYDGYRALLDTREDRVRLRSRHGTDLTRRFPELGQPLGKQLVLDGELVALDSHGRPRFEWLQSRTGTTTFVAFDLLVEDGADLCHMPYVERRARLEALGLNGPSVITAGVQYGRGAELLAVSRLHQIEGIVAKRLDSPYRPGTRSRHWLKIKNRIVSELVVGGWRCDRRTGAIDTLLLGEPLAHGSLRYRGVVELGLNGALLAELTKVLPKLARKRTPFSSAVTASFVEPVLVAVVQHVCSPGDVLREACIRGLNARSDMQVQLQATTARRDSPRASSPPGTFRGICRSFRGN